MGSARKLQLVHGNVPVRVRIGTIAYEVQRRARPETSVRRLHMVRDVFALTAQTQRAQRKRPARAEHVFVANPVEATLSRRQSCQYAMALLESPRSASASFAAEAQLRGVHPLERQPDDETTRQVQLTRIRVPAQRRHLQKRFLRFTLERHGGGRGRDCGTGGNQGRVGRVPMVEVPHVGSYLPRMNHGAFEHDV